MKRKGIALVLATALVMAPGPVSAFAVYDGANYAQNLLTAVRSLAAVRHLAEMVSGLEQDLRQLGFDGSAVLDTGKAWLHTLFANAPGIAWERSTAADSVAALFPDTIAPALTRATRVLEAETRATTVRESWRHSHGVQTGMIEENRSAETLLGNLVSESRGAVGALSVTQAGNQIAAMQVREQLRTQALVAAHQRAQAEERLRLDTAARAAQARFGASIGTGNLYTRLP
ncbi:MAG: hypothetical protein J4F47_09070 [Alphaproteobacteria bacterium]|nr:hypothetical protein [Alphaproteobacteria bacterium]